MIKLIGYLLTEGCLSKSKKIGGGMCLSVSQSKKKYFNELNLLEFLPFTIFIIFLLL